MVAEMVRRWGAFAGDDDQIRKGEEHHAHGYMEYDPLWDFLFNPNPPKDTDGRREESGRGVRELQGK